MENIQNNNIKSKVKNINNKEILEKIDEIVEVIKQDPIYIRYQILKKEMTSNKEIIKVINEVKDIQKEIVKLEYYKKDTKEKITLLDNYLRDLDNCPLYHEFINAQEEVDNTLQQVKFIIEKIINDKLK